MERSYLPYDGIQPILDYLLAERCIDAAGYRRNTIQRRFSTRLAATGMPDYQAYLDYLKQHPVELDNLASSLSIKVSHFFRNPVVFEILKAVVLPELIEFLRDQPLRVWCAGCARGEEAYSLALLFKELSTAGTEFPPPFIVATDIDLQALEQARIGRYAAESLNEVRKGDLDRWFLQDGTCFRLREEIREMVTFAHHELTSLKAPAEGIFSGYHLIVCRNVMIYFGQQLKERVLEFLTRSLAGNGALVLGEAEVLPEVYDREYVEIVRRTRIYQKGTFR